MKETEQAVDPVQQAMSAWVQRETMATMAAAERLRAALAEHEAAVLEDARLRAHGAVMAALGVGEAPKPLEALEAAKDTLLDALECFWDLLDPQDSQQPQQPQEDSAQETKSSWDDPRVLEDVRSLVQVVFSPDYDSEPPARLVHLLRAHVAQCRRLMEEVPMEHAAHQTLVQTLRRLGAIRGTANVDAFIHGLARHHQADWTWTAEQTLRDLAHYDMDASQDQLGVVRDGGPASP